jgi:hypothetical protein
MLVLRWGDLTPTPTLSGTAMPSALPSVQPTTARAAMFVLHLAAQVSATTSFGLYLQTDPAGVGQEGHAFCGPGEYDPKPCDPAASPFSRLFAGFEIGTTLVYRFERFDGPTRVEVLLEGREVFDGSLTVDVSYP